MNLKQRQRQVKCEVCGAFCCTDVKRGLEREQTEDRIKAFQIWIWSRINKIKRNDRLSNEESLDRITENNIVISRKR